MPIILNDVLPPAGARILLEAAADLDFEDGRKTAGKAAVAVKANAQAIPGPDTDAILEKAQTSLLAHPLFPVAAYPRSFARMIVSRTGGGGQYGDHVDNALMGGARTDLSFTLFLTPTDAYDGGELTVTDRLEDRQFKLEPGSAILYPSTTLHRVEPVTRGERIVVVGWITSHIRDAARREILFDLWRAAEAAGGGNRDTSLLLAKSRSNLLRMWAD